MLNSKILTTIAMLSLLILGMKGQENFHHSNEKRTEYGLSSDISTKLLNEGLLKTSRMNLDIYYPISDVKLLGKTSVGLIEIQPEIIDSRINDYFFGIKAGGGYDFLKRTKFSIGVEALVGYSFGMQGSNEDFDFLEWDVSIKFIQKRVFTSVGVNRIYLSEPKFNKPAIFIRIGTIL